MPSPLVSMPQPLPCVSATTPSTLGNADQLVAREMIGDAADNGGGAVDGRQDADVVARRNPAVLPDDAHEGRGRRDVLRRLHVGAECVVAVETPHFQVVQVHVLARRDVAAREADDLVVALDRRAGANRACRELVPHGDEARDGDVLFGDPRPANQLGAGDDDVVGRMQPYGERGAGQHWNPFCRTFRHRHWNGSWPDGRSPQSPNRCRAPAHPAARRNHRPSSSSMS